MIIYKFTNLVNGKCYVGATKQSLEIRIAEHKRKKLGTLYPVIEEVGTKNIKFEIIDTAETIEELNTKEIYWIDKLNTMTPNGYNLCIGGGTTTGYRHREDSKKSMSIKKSKMYVGDGNPFYGKHHSEEAKERMRIAKTGRKLTEEWKKNIAISQKVKVVNLDTKEVFDSIKEAGEKYNIFPTHITRVCKGKRKRTGGYRWQYYSEYMTIPCEASEDRGTCND